MAFRDTGSDVASHSVPEKESVKECSNLLTSMQKNNETGVNRKVQKLSLFMFCFDNNKLYIDKCLKKEIDRYISSRKFVFSCCSRDNIAQGLAADGACS